VSPDIRGQVMTSGMTLTQEDAGALRRTAQDVSDLDARTLQRAQASFKYAYEVALRVSNGTLDPLSA
jgi:hypothetical protein